jgi:hypothetical protein
MRNLDTVRTLHCTLVIVLTLFPEFYTRKVAHASTNALILVFFEKKEIIVLQAPMLLTANINVLPLLHTWATAGSQIGSVTLDLSNFAKNLTLRDHTPFFSCILDLFHQELFRVIHKTAQYYL